MLNEKGFDQWAKDYEQSVALSDADDRYPFAGYRDILDTICRNRHLNTNLIKKGVVFMKMNRVWRVHAS